MSAILVLSFDPKSGQKFVRLSDDLIDPLT